MDWVLGTQKQGKGAPQPVGSQRGTWLELNFKDLCWEMKGGGSGKTLDGVPWPAGGHWGSSPGRVPV